MKRTCGVLFATFTLLASAEVLAQCLPATFTVTSTRDGYDANPGDGVCADDRGGCTLRSALEEANAALCEPTTVRFDIPGSGPHTISLTVDLDPVVKTVIVDGYSQPGASRNTAGALTPGNAQLMVEVSGAGHVGYGLYFSCPDGEARSHVVAGLVLNGFTSAALGNYGCDGASFLGNYIGINFDGESPGFGGVFGGVLVVNAQGNRIGSASPGDRNVIAGTSLVGVYVNGTSTATPFLAFDNQIVNNFIGTTAAGDRGISPYGQGSGTGVAISGAGVSPNVPDPDPSTPFNEKGNLIALNVIAGSSSLGIGLGGGQDAQGEVRPASAIRVVSNIIGHGTQARDFLATEVGGLNATPPPDDVSLANKSDGIRVGSTAYGGSPANDVYIERNAVLQSDDGVDFFLGSGHHATSNVIVGNRAAGIRAAGLVELTQNRIWDNGDLGIAMTVADAEPLPWIVLDDLTDNVVHGTFDLPITLSAGFVCVRTVVEVFANDTCDPSGAGEGRELLDTLTFDECTGSFTYVPSPLPPPRPQLTATATWTLGVNVGAGVLEVGSYSSDFSNCVGNTPPVVAMPIPDRFATVGEELVFAVPGNTFVDPDGDSLSYESTLADGSPLPGWLSFHASTLTYRGTPALTDVGVWNVRLTATDTSGPASASDDFLLEVVESPPPIGWCGDPAIPIHAIQGNASTSPLEGLEAVVEGVVVGDFQGPDGLRGFFVQEEDADQDGDPATSEGLFVFDGGLGPDVSVGDRVRVGGTVEERFGLTELGALLGVEICEPGAGGASAASVTFPLEERSELESFEGMLVSIPQKLFVSGNFDQGRFGEVDLSVGGRLYEPTQVVSPGVAAAALQDLNDRSRILLDDGSEVQRPLPLPPYLGLDGTLRVGDVTRDLTGVLSFGFGEYRVQPTAAVAFERVNDRPTAVPDVGGRLHIAVFNVLNYFTTVDAGVPACGPSGVQDCRGADSAAELERQRAKLVAALAELDADVVGLVELENDASRSIQDLVEGVNAVVGPGVYDFIDTGTVGTDAIKVGLIYKAGSVLPTGTTAVLDEVFPFNANTRPPVAQAFEDIATGRVVTVVVSHFKSKGSACDAVPNPDTGTDFVDPDTGDGQGNCNLTRVAAAMRLIEWLSGDPTGSGSDRSFVIGDLNAYENEDPLRAFEDAGYTNLLRRFGGDEAYSYVFDARAGTLDYVLASPAVLRFVTGASAWHVNADEPRALDYDELNQPLLFSPDAFRSSDHDPIVVGMDLLPTLTVAIDVKPFFAVNPILPRSGIPIPVAVLADDGFDPRDVDPVTVRFGPAGATARFRPFFFDVNRDARKDLVLFFTSRDTGIPCGATEAHLSGFTFDGVKIQGADSVRTLLCRK